jgi:phosphoribosylformylglycinamidine synthase
MEINLANVPRADADLDHVVLYSESPGRFIVTIDPKQRSSFEARLAGLPCACIGQVTPGPDFVVNGLDGRPVIHMPVSELKAAWKRPFGDLV